MPGHVHEGVKNLLAARPDLLLRLLAVAARAQSQAEPEPEPESESEQQPVLHPLSNELPYMSPAKADAEPATPDGQPSTRPLPTSMPLVNLLLVDLCYRYFCADEEDLTLLLEIHGQNKDAKTWAWIAYWGVAHHVYKRHAKLALLPLDLETLEWMRAHVQDRLAAIEPLLLDATVLSDPKSETEVYADPEWAAIRATMRARMGLSVTSAGCTLEALKVVDSKHGSDYARLLMSALPPEIANAMKRDPQTEPEITEFERGGWLYQRSIEVGREYGRSEGLEQGREQGLEQGRAEGILRTLLAVLSARGFTPTAAHYDRLLAADCAQLEAWAPKAVSIEGIEELFD